MLIGILLWLTYWVGPGVLGWLAMRAANRARGKNGKTALNWVSWGFWLTYIRFLGPLLLPSIIGMLAWPLLLIPSILCFFMAGSTMVKEARSQAKGDYTEKAR